MTVETNQTILVVDDDQTVRDWVTLLLSKRGCLVQSARDVESAYRIIAADTPDVILVDLDLARMDVHAFKSFILIRNPEAKVLAMTALPHSRADQKHGLRILVKPIEEAELISAIGSCDGK
ncbi:MAG TPA: response regulator [Planctomycetota bacterium]|nr:response regulator [Planctomycetota bacterium]